MNGTALRKPTAGGWWAWWRHRHHRPWHCAFQAVPPRQRLHQRPEHAAGGAARHLAAPRTCARTSCFSCWNSGSGASTSALAPLSTASASGTLSRRSMTHSRPLRRRAVAGGAVGVGHRGGAGHGVGRFALPDRRPRHRALRLPFPRSAGLHTLPVLRVPHLHRCAQRPAVLAAGWPCGPWHLDLCVLPWALHPVLRSDVLPEGAAIQTEQLRNPAASNHTLRGSFLLLPLSRK